MHILYICCAFFYFIISVYISFDEWFQLRYKNKYAISNCNIKNKEDNGNIYSVVNIDLSVLTHVDNEGNKLLVTSVAVKTLLQLY